MKYFIVNKPYGYLSQFTDEAGRQTLKNLYNFPPGVYPVGRLDRDSEGLLIITDDKFLTDYLLNPLNKHEREYFVQVEGSPSEEQLSQLEKGVIIEGRLTLPAKAKLLDKVNFAPRVPPIRERKNIPDTWISLTLVEGKNRQVRKMTARIGFPTLRLIRVRIKNVLLGDLKPGKVRELFPDEIKSLMS